MIRRWFVMHWCPILGYGGGPIGWLFEDTGNDTPDRAWATDIARGLRSGGWPCRVGWRWGAP